jgi:hypothetical protein
MHELTNQQRLYLPNKESLEEVVRSRPKTLQELTHKLHQSKPERTLPPFGSLPRPEVLEFLGH